MRRRRQLLEAGIFAVGIGIGVACAHESNAQTRDRLVPDDTAAVSRILTVVRGSNPVVCELTVRNADMYGSWFSRGSISGAPLEVDSAASALLDWVQRSHNDPLIVPPLSAGLRDPDPCVRRVSASLLSRVRHAAAITAMRAALGDANGGTREVAALAIGMANAEEGVVELQRRLRDELPSVRRAAAWALGELEAQAAVPALLDLLARDPDARVRQAAAWAIGSIR